MVDGSEWVLAHLSEANTLQFRDGHLLRTLSLPMILFLGSTPLA